MKKVLVAVCGKKNGEDCKSSAASIYRFIRDEPGIDAKIRKIDGGHELIRIIGSYDIVIMFYRTCLTDAIIISEKYLNVKYILFSEYVNRKELALEKGFCVADSLTEVVRFVREEDG